MYSHLNSYFQTDLQKFEPKVPFHSQSINLFFHSVEKFLLSPHSYQYCVISIFFLIFANLVSEKREPTDVLICFVKLLVKLSILKHVYWLFVFLFSVNLPDELIVHFSIGLPVLFLLIFKINNVFRSLLQKFFS